MAASSSLLRLQDDHISSALSETNPRILRHRRASFEDPHQAIEPYLRSAGFYHVSQIGHFNLEPGLISGLIERWRPETHTFHLPCGECTITLEDVALHLGLPIDGKPVTGAGLLDWNEVCSTLLGEAPPEDVIRGSTLKLNWLEKFKNLPQDATDDQIQYAARAYILRLIGGMLMPDKTSNRVHLKFLPLLADLSHAGNYSWGSACLGWLYREMCRAAKPNRHDIGGCLVLLQSWAWYRMPFLRPLTKREICYPLARRWSDHLDHRNTPRHIFHIRLRLDRMAWNEFKWTPYASHEIRDILPVEAYTHCELWSTCTALICFAIVEWHHADRVMRQFGMLQPIPHEPMNLDDLHRIDMRGQHEIFWPHRHADWINWWDKRYEQIPTGYTAHGQLMPSRNYIQWYMENSRPFLVPTNEDVRGRSFPERCCSVDPPQLRIELPRPKLKRRNRR